LPETTRIIRRRRRKVRVVFLFGCKNNVVVVGTKRFERKPIKSRVSAFPDVFSVANFRLKSAKRGSEPRVRFRLATGEFSNNWCMFVKWKRQSGIACNQERAE